MAGKIAASAIAALVCFSWESSALSCSPAYYKPPAPEEIQKRARRVIEQASAIIDGEVVRVQTLEQPAQIRVHRIFKGPDKAIFEVAAGTTCDSGPGNLGERRRYVLFGGPVVYRMDAFVETIFTINKQIELAPYIDKELGSVRENEWPYVPGTRTP